MGIKGSLLLISISNVNQVVSMPQVDFGIDLCFLWDIKKIS